MASQLKVDTITGVTTAGSISITGEGNSTTTNLQQGLAKAWIRANEASLTIGDSFNVGSRTDTAVGRMNVNLSNNMANSEYSMVGSQSDDGRAQNCYSPSTSEYEAMTTLTSNQAACDVAHNCSAILGDLA